MRFAYANKKDLDLDTKEDWVPVVVIHQVNRGGVEIAAVVFMDEHYATYETVKADDLIDAQTWQLSDSWEAIFGSKETLIEEHPDDWQEIYGKTRFFRLVTDVDELKNREYEYGEPMWR